MARPGDDRRIVLTESSVNGFTHLVAGIWNGDRV